MKVRKFQTFRELAPVLLADSGRTFCHRWQNAPPSESFPPEMRRWLSPVSVFNLPGRSGETEVPKFLYRGEPALFSSSLSSRGRLAKDGRFGATELEFLDQLTNMAALVWYARILDEFRAIGWPQHYGFPTTYLDLTSNPAVALHFAVPPAGLPPTRKVAIFRIDLEAIIEKVYGVAGRTTPLA